MDYKKLKKHLAHFEISAGLLGIAVSVYSLIQRFRCPEDAHGCGGHEMMGAWFGFCLGMSLITSGLLMKFGGIVSWLGHLAIAYAAVLIYFID